MMPSRQMWPDGIDTGVRSLRSPSISSEVLSTSAKSTTTVTVPQANPLPAYIAPSGASNLVSTELDRTVLASTPALNLVNEFLDQVLYNILATARSVSLGAVRAAVPSVLKPRLGKAAVRAAEEDLKEYLEDEEEAELNSRRSPLDAKPYFDLELAWKLARLRCMVYAQLGDLEEEDEEEWSEKEQLLVQANTFKAEHHTEIELSPASAIFLASVIEYLGQQALLYAAQYAVRRHDLLRTQVASNAQTATLTPQTDEIILEGKDMNHVGRDSPLSRLWRSWRRNTRDASSGLTSPDTLLSPTSPAHSRNGSQVPNIQQITEEKNGDLQHSPSQIPLPETDNDVNEIEVPGLASAISDSEDDALEASGPSRRPASMVAMPGAFPDQFLSAEPNEESSNTSSQQIPRPLYARKRSLSVPTLRQNSLRLYKTKPRQPESDDAQQGSDELTADSTQRVADSPATPGTKSRRATASSRDPGSPSKRQGMVGGGLAAAVGALGAGAAVTDAVSSKDVDEHGNAQELRQLTPSPPIEKQTAVQAMLGTTADVPPPKDAATGASITNVADFDSMYVPVDMSGDEDDVERNKEGSKDEADQATTISRKPIAARVPDPTPNHTFEEYRQDVGVPTSSDSMNRLGSGAKFEAEDEPISPDSSVPQPTTQEVVESPVSPVQTTKSQPITKNTASGVHHEPKAPLRQDPLAGHPVRHKYAESQASARSHHSKSSSSSSRLLGFTRDATGRPHTLAQQYPPPIITDYQQRTAYEPPSQPANQVAGPASSSPTARLSMRGHGVDQFENEQKKKSLEVLIQSNETLHYTLTPATAMKEEEAVTPTRRTETQDMADFLRNTGPPGSQQTRTARVSPTAAVHVNTNSHLGARASPTPPVPPPKTKGFIPSSRNYPQMASSPNRRRNPLGEARDPRTESTSALRDLADYARSTGPRNESQLPQALAPRSNMQQAMRSNNDVRTENTSVSGNRSRFQARDARPKTNGTSDLIDFIREGPPRETGDHRIDRRVAPFRTTMDSEDLNNLAPNVEEVSAGYMPHSAQSDRSAEYSANSGATLANRNVNGSSNHATNHAASYGTPKNRYDDDGMPQRTRRRIKDPYAIDYSDDEDLEDYGQPVNSNEESLIDFLRNTAPPPGMAPQPIYTQGQINSSRTPNQQFAGLQQSNSAREASPHLTQSGSKMDTYKPTQITHATHVDRNRNKPRVEAREARSNRFDTSDLADYLRNSGPPPSMAAETQPFSSMPVASQAQREGNGLFRSLTKRKAK